MHTDRAVRGTPRDVSTTGIGRELGHGDGSLLVIPSPPVRPDSESRAIRRTEGLQTRIDPPQPRWIDARIEGRAGADLVFVRGEGVRVAQFIDADNLLEPVEVTAGSGAVVDLCRLIRIDASR